MDLSTAFIMIKIQIPIKTNHKMFSILIDNKIKINIPKIQMGSSTFSF